MSCTTYMQTIIPILHAYLVCIFSTMKPLRALHTGAGSDYVPNHHHIQNGSLHTRTRCMRRFAHTYLPPLPPVWGKSPQCPERSSRSLFPGGGPLLDQQSPMPWSHRFETLYWLRTLLSAVLYNSNWRRSRVHAYIYSCMNSGPSFGMHSTD